MLNIKTNQVLSSYTNKNGEKNVIIRARITDKKIGYPTKIIKTIDLPVFFNNDKIYLNHKAFKNKEFDVEYLLRIATIEKRFKNVIIDFLKVGNQLKLNNITKAVYLQDETIGINNSLPSYDVITTPSIVNSFNLNTPKEHHIDSVPSEVVTRFKALKRNDFIDDETGEDNDVDDVADNLLGAFYENENKKALNLIDFNIRYNNGQFDINNIFDVFGYCVSNDPIKNKPRLSNEYRSILVRLADYRFNAKPSERVTDFNLNWVNNFMMFLRDKGYSCIKTKKMNPLYTEKYKDEFINNERKFYKVSSFNNIRKQLNTMIDYLQGQEMLPLTISSNLIKLNSYVDADENIDRRNHTLYMNDITTILNHRSTGDKEIARLTFLIQIVAGGLRNADTFNDKFKLEKDDEGYYFSIYSTKVRKIIKNPIIEGVGSELLKQLNYQLPAFITDEEKYRKALKDLFIEIPIERKIETYIQYAGKEVEMITDNLTNIINPYFARKTFVMMGCQMGWSFDTIKQFTGHSSVKTIERYYFESLELVDKRKMMNK